jgi:hypothetical protein
MLRSRFSTLLCSAAVFVGLVGVATAETFVEQSTGLAITSPDSWKSTTGDPLTVSSPDDLVQVIVTTVPSDSVEEAVKQLSVELTKIFTDIKVEGDLQETKINDMDCVYLSGDAKIEGNIDIEFTMAIVDAGDNCLIVVGFGTPEGIKAHHDDAVGIIRSVHKP